MIAKDNITFILQDTILSSFCLHTNLVENIDIPLHCLIFVNIETGFVFIENTIENTISAKLEITPYVSKLWF